MVILLYFLCKYADRVCVELIRIYMPQARFGNGACTDFLSRQGLEPCIPSQLIHFYDKTLLCNIYFTKNLENLAFLSHFLRFSSKIINDKINAALATFLKISFKIT